MSSRLSSARRVVIKIGSALLVEAASGAVKRAWLDSLAKDIAGLKAAGADVLIVSSGAIALGRRKLSLKNGMLKLEEKQAAAAVGQIALAQAWANALGTQGLAAGQVLLTLTDTESRRRYLNARATLFTLLRQSAIPVINENDTVATSEIRYGDNDRLAARVASMVSADCLVLLSDVDGFYTTSPAAKGAELIAEVTEITPDISAMAGRSDSDVGSGGMITKIEAARIATSAGANMVIASGHPLHPLKCIIDGGTCSWFNAAATPAAARKRWIAGALTPVGRIVVDGGAAAALRRDKSLLPAGVTAVEGQFSRGDTVSIVTPGGKEIARGLIAYDCADAEKIIGRQSSEIASLLGFSGRDEMVHRDDLVLLGS